VQFNIVSADTLKEAKERPDKYKNLVVKVAGYSALFVTLDEQLQDQIIARTEHAM
jgi:formate C-acetyltransferase